MNYFYSCLFIVLLIIDLEHGILPNKIVYPGIVIALVVATLGSIFGLKPESIFGPGAGMWLIDSATSAITTGQWAADRVVFFAASNDPQPLPTVTTLFDNGLVCSMAGVGISAALLVQLKT